MSEHILTDNYVCSIDDQKPGNYEPWVITLKQGSFTECQARLSDPITDDQIKDLQARLSKYEVITPYVWETLLSWIVDKAKHRTYKLGWWSTALGMNGIRFGIKFYGNTRPTDDPSAMRSFKLNNELWSDTSWTD